MIFYKTKTSLDIFIFAILVRAYCTFYALLSHKAIIELLHWISENIEQIIKNVNQFSCSETHTCLFAENFYILVYFITVYITLKCVLLSIRIVLILFSICLDTCVKHWAHQGKRDIRRLSNHLYIFSCVLRMNINLYTYLLFYDSYLKWKLLIECSWLSW